MAADTFQTLLNSLGFSAAEGAAELGMIQRKKALASSKLDMAAEEARRQLATDFESRGVLLSGEANLGMARQAAREATAKTELEVAEADDILALARRLQRAQAEKEAADREFELRRRMFDESMALSRQQAAESSKLSREQFEAELRRMRLIEQAQNQAPAAQPTFNPYSYLKMKQGVLSGLQRFRGW